MSILGDRVEVAIRVGRALSNALLLAYDDKSGTEFAAARQKGGAAVLLGFKNGGKASYTITAGDATLDVSVADTTSVAKTGGHSARSSGRRQPPGSSRPAGRCWPTSIPVWTRRAARGRIR